MKILSAEYFTSVVSSDKILNDGIEFAFVGRSNVGKSSFINSLVGQKKLCKTSSLPGRTRMINYFNIKTDLNVLKNNANDSSLDNTLESKEQLTLNQDVENLDKSSSRACNSFRFVDLPGYGYAKAGKQNKMIWANIMEDYLTKTKCLKRVFLLVDIRINPTELDIRMFKYLFYYGIPTTIVATKCDKLPKSKISAYVQNVASILNVGKDNIIPYSSETNYNKEKILQEIECDLIQNK